MTDRRVALVLDIGFGTLLGSRRSAERITAHLQARGFEVLALQGADVTRDRIRGELLHARRQLGPGDAFALYFVGHGDRLRADGGPPRPGVPQAGERPSDCGTPQGPGRPATRTSATTRPATLRIP